MSGINTSEDLTTWEGDGLPELPSPALKVADLLIPEGEKSFLTDLYQKMNPKDGSGLTEEQRENYASYLNGEMKVGDMSSLTATIAREILRVSGLGKTL